VRIRAELERIARDQLSSRDLIQVFEDRIRNNNLLIKSSPVTDEERAKLKQDTEWCKQQIAHCSRFSPRRRKTTQLRTILLLWKEQGGADPVITDRRWDEPVNLYLQAASKFTRGKALSQKRARKVIGAWIKLVASTRLNGGGSLSAYATIIPSSGQADLTEP
jgi:hypothetical protein